MIVNNNTDLNSPQRAHPRAPLQGPVEVKTRSRLSMGQIENISIGGLLATCEPTPAVATELELLFNLTPGCTVSTTAVVRHASRTVFGVQFHDLSPASQQAIAEYCQMVLNHGRRSGRISRRLLVTIRGTRKNDLDELAETLTLSRNGGSLASRAAFAVGKQLELFWPEKKRRTEIKIVSNRPIRGNGLLELGFEFVDPKIDFWQLDFPNPS